MDTDDIGACSSRRRLDAVQGSLYNAAVQPRWRWLIVAFLLVAGFLITWRYRMWRDHRFDAAIRVAARRYSVEPALVKAVVWRESWFNPIVRGRAGEIGLMQIRTAAAKEWAQAEKIKTFSSEQLFDPGTNLMAGAWYLQKLVRRYQATDDPLPYALADYNAGRSHVLEWNKGAATTNSLAFIERIEYPGTRRYVRAVIRRCDQYRRIFPEPHP